MAPYIAKCYRLVFPVGSLIKPTEQCPLDAYLQSTIYANMRSRHDCRTALSRIGFIRMKVPGRHIRQKKEFTSSDKWLLLINNDGQIYGGFEYAIYRDLKGVMSLIGDDIEVDEI